MLIEQTSPYYDTIRDLYRWAIGIKNIELAGRQYAEKSQLVSKDYTIPQGISQVMIEADEFPQQVFVANELTSGAEIGHEISIDGGMTWKSISPSYLTSTGIAPEVIYINSVDASGLIVGDNHLNSTIESNTIRYRLSLSKNTDYITDSNLIPYYSPVVRKVSLNVITREGS
jgi:hypothetical protein